MIDQNTELRIVELRAENYLRLKAVRIRPDGSVVQIKGRNDAGKSSVLSVITHAIGIKEWTPAVPLRKGEKHGALFLDMGELRITKIFTEGEADRLVFEYKDGSRPRSPQKVLEELRGQMIDPLAFIRAKDADRLTMMQSLFPDFDFSVYARERQRAYAHRTLLNRQVKQANAAIAELRQTLPPGEKPTPVDVSAIAEQIRQANAANLELDKRAARRERTRMEAEQLFNEAELLRAQAAEKEARAAELQHMVDAANPLPDPVNTAPLEKRLAHSAEIAGVIKEFDDIERMTADATRLKGEADKLTLAIDDLDARKVKAMAGKLPYPGLSVTSTDDETHVVLNDLPFSQGSQAEQIKAATAIAMRLAPRIKVLLIRDGSLLDTHSMALVAKIAEEHSFQVWVERVTDDNSGAGIMIEDGEVKNG